MHINNGLTALSSFYLFVYIDRNDGHLLVRLGLSISRGIIESHGGKFYLDQTAKATTFVIELPLVSSFKI